MTRPLLGAAGRLRLAELASRPLLVGLDFDGTLAPLVDQPSRAALSLKTRGLLERLSGSYPVLVLSGRARADVAARVGVGGIEVIGNHGAERELEVPSALLRRVRRWREQLEPLVARTPGLWLEDKRISLSVHLRQVPLKSAALAQLARVRPKLKGARFVHGKEVVNVVSRSADDKGAAVRHALERRGLEHALFVGDDLTDEDVFRLQPEGWLDGANVGRGRTLARWRLATRGQVDALLQQLISLRR